MDWGPPRRVLEGWFGAIVWKQGAQQGEWRFCFQWDIKRKGWELPKGGREQWDDSPFATAVRELEEEALVTLTQQRTDWYWVDKHGCFVTPTAASSNYFLTHGGYLVTPLMEEQGDLVHEDLDRSRWMTRNEFANVTKRKDHLKVLTTIERSWQEELAVSRRDVPHGRGTEAVLSLAVVSAVTCCVCLHLVDLTQAVQCTAFVPGNGTACPHLLHANCITTNTLVCPCTGLTKQCPCKPPEPPLARVTSLTAVSNPSSSSSSSGPTPPMPAA